MAEQHGDKHGALLEALRALNSPYKKIGVLREFHNTAATVIEELQRELAAAEDRYQSAVHGRSEFRKALKTARQEGAGSLAGPAAGGEPAAPSASAASSTPRITATHPPTTDARRIDNLRRVEADDSVNAFARSICGEAAARLVELTTVSAIEPSSPATDALDAICKMLGCKTWEYPGQVVRDVKMAVDVLRDVRKCGEEGLTIDENLRGRIERLIGTSDDGAEK